MMSETEIAPEEKTIPFFPDHIRTEAYVTLGILVIVFIVGILGSFLPVGLQEPADPMNTPAHAKPEWYFLFLYQLLKYVSKTAGVVIPVVGLIVLTIWPFLDRREDTIKARRLRWALVIVTLAAIIALTVLGEIT
jgi:quinol-cytochrome oxidoreductase complex cytochrome b subunit